MLMVTVLWEKLNIYGFDHKEKNPRIFATFTPKNFTKKNSYKMIISNIGKRCTLQKHPSRQNERQRLLRHLEANFARRRPHRGGLCSLNVLHVSTQVPRVVGIRLHKIDVGHDLVRVDQRGRGLPLLLLLHLQKKFPKETWILRVQNFRFHFFLKGTINNVTLKRTNC